MEITWQDPPAPANGPGSGGSMQQFAEALKENPGEWALDPTGPFKNQPNVSNINGGRLKAFLPAGSFEAVGRKREDGQSDRYVRYVGEVAS